MFLTMLGDLAVFQLYVTLSVLYYIHIYIYRQTDIKSHRQNVTDRQTD